MTAPYVILGVLVGGCLVIAVWAGQSWRLARRDRSVVVERPAPRHRANVDGTVRR